MALPFKKQGGGFLNGVAGTVVSYALDSKTWDAKKKGGDPYTTISVELEIRPDGADAPVSQFLQAGFLYENHNISDDNLTLESDDDRPVITEDSEFGRFLQSAVEVGFPETPLVEANLRSFACLVNQRFVFKRALDEPLMERFKSEGRKLKTKGKDGKDYFIDALYPLTVAEYLGEADAQPKGKASGKRAAATTPSGTKTLAATKGGKTNGAAKNADADALIAQGEDVLLTILADSKDKDDNQKPIDRSGLSAKILRYAVDNGLDTETREALRKLLGSEDFLSRQSGWTFEAKEKGQPVALA